MNTYNIEITHHVQGWRGLNLYQETITLKRNTKKSAISDIEEIAELLSLKFFSIIRITNVSSPEKTKRRHKLYSIWVEGYCVTGNSDKARKISEVRAKSFKAACVAYSKLPESKWYGNFNKNRLSFGGCRLFDNELDARKSFG